MDECIAAVGGSTRAAQNDAATNTLGMREIGTSALGQVLENVRGRYDAPSGLDTRRTLSSNLRLVERQPLDPPVFSHPLPVLAKDPVACYGKHRRIARLERLCELAF